MKSFFRSLSFFAKDPVALVYAMIPILIGVLIYSFGFYWAKDLIMAYLEKKAVHYLEADSFSFTMLYFFVKWVFYILSFFVVNWTFVLIISFIAGPFNDLISERVERKLRGKQQRNIKEGFSHLFGKIGFTIINELKKIFFIGFLTTTAVVFGYIPLLTPISLGLSFFLIAIQFVDYSWSRNDLPLRLCVKDLKINFFRYGISGAIYFLLINIPFVNLFIPAVATAQYTILFVDRSLHKLKVQE
jgi:uncharacterized protein involved in cysteine biosynthesis